MFQNMMLAKFEPNRMQNYPKLQQKSLFSAPLQKIGGNKIS
jgi:hypothetical protein